VSFEGFAEALLVRVFHEALIVSGQVAHDGVVALFHCALNLFRALPFGEDGGMDDEPKRMPSDEVDASLTREDVEAAVDGDRDDGQPQFVCQLEGSSAELCHVTGEGACPFGEDHKRYPMLKHLPCLFVSPVNSFWPALIDHDMSCTFAGFPYERDASQAFLHHPAEAASQEAIDEEDVVGALMVGNKDIRLLLVEQFSSLHFDREQHYPAHQSAPHHCGVIAPRLGIAEGAANNHGNRRRGSCQQEYWHGDEELVKSIEEFQNR